MPPTLADRVFHIPEAINDIEHGLSGVSFEQFVGDRFLRSAIERLLEIITEASRHLPADVKDAETSIPWRSMVDFGNQLRHAYHNVDPSIVWRIVKTEMPRSKLLPSA